MTYKPMTDDELREASWTARGVQATWLETFRAIEQAVLSRIAEQSLVIVPRKPSLNMIKAFWGEVPLGDAELSFARDCYKTMLEATKEST